MELDNLFSNINLDYVYDSAKNLEISEEILNTENINEIYKMCHYIKAHFVIDTEHSIYENVAIQEKEKIKQIEYLVNNIIFLYPIYLIDNNNNKELILRYFEEFYFIARNLCFT